MIFFTICSRNFTAYSGALWTSLRRVYPEAKFYSVLCDDDSDFDWMSLQYPLVFLPDLGISRIAEMKNNYNITELNTALKPYAFQYIFDKHPGEPVVYLDPDIFLVSRLEELEDRFAKGADCVLTPHICEPAEHAEMSDLKFLTYGIYNFGFCALRDTPQIRRLVAWWGRRLEEYCVIDTARGLFVDQKWGDYFPAFVEHTSILRHPGYNVAYWNLSQRRLANRNGSWTVNGLPLRFLHFSGNRIEDEGVFTRHAGQFNVRNTPALFGLLNDYRDAIFRSGQRYYSVIPYAFSWSGASGFNEHTPEALRRTISTSEELSPHLPLARFNSISQWNADRRFNQKTIRERRAVEMASICKDQSFGIDGYCIMCRGQRSFITSLMYGIPGQDDGDALLPNWREHLSCAVCGSINRERAFLHIIEQERYIRDDDDIYITEQITRFFGLLKSRWPKLIGSEYTAPNCQPGTVVNGIRHEDVQNLSFPTASLDTIMSLDVLEHVPYPDLAFVELHRCLRPGGRLVFMVPFDCTRDTDKIRAVLADDGTINHILPEEYHGNPMDIKGGALCFRYFSWGVIDDLRKAGFEHAEVISYWSDSLKHYGDPQFMITAQKAR